MKLKLLAFFSFFTLGYMAIAQVVTAPPALSELGQYLASLLTLKGASPLIIAAAVIQGLMYLVREIPDGKVSGKMKLVIVLGLSCAAGVVTSMIQGFSLGAALVSSSSLAALQVFAWEIYSNFIQKPAPSIS